MVLMVACTSKSPSRQINAMLKRVDVAEQRISKLYDNDFNKEKNYGRIDGTRLADLFGIEQIEIPTGYKCKDPSDLYHTFGGDTVRKVITHLLHQEQ